MKNVKMKVDEFESKVISLVHESIRVWNETVTEDKEKELMNELSERGLLEVWKVLSKVEI